MPNDWVYRCMLFSFVYVNNKQIGLNFSSPLLCFQRVVVLYEIFIRLSVVRIYVVIVIALVVDSFVVPWIFRHKYRYTQTQTYTLNKCLREIWMLNCINEFLSDFLVKCWHTCFEWHLRIAFEVDCALISEVSPKIKLCEWICKTVKNTNWRKSIYCYSIHLPIRDIHIMSSIIMDNEIGFKTVNFR